MYYLKTESSFDSAHFLKGYDGKCRNIHGHCWRVVVYIGSDSLKSEGQTRGMVVDFGDLKSALKVLCDEFDHCLIYEENTLKKATVDALKAEDFRLIEIPFRPTAENFAKYFYDRLKAQGMPIHRLEVYETPKNCAIYEE